MVRKVTLRTDKPKPTARKVVAYRGAQSGTVYFPRDPDDFSGKGYFFCEGVLKDSQVSFGFMSRHSQTYTPIYEDENAVLEIRL